MSERDARAPGCTVFGLLWIALLLGYCAWVVISAIHSGVLKWGALAEYSLFPYVMLLGLMCSGYVLTQGRAVGLKSMFMVLFLGYGMALQSMKPVPHIPAEFRWVFDFIAYVTAFAAISAGIVLEKALHARRGGIE